MKLKDFLTGKNNNGEKTTFSSLFGKVWNYIKTGQMPTAPNIISDDLKDPYNDASFATPSDRFKSQQQRMLRFLKGNEFGTQSSNSVFPMGFDDPTHLTFKVEFGEWGASIMSDDEILNLQVNSYDSGVYYMDYDQFPMGLLSLARSENFQDIQTYSSFSYLWNRNEDRRAQYIYDFVDGIYALQRDFPYIFQKISGLDKLTDFDASRGQRLKDARIQLSCLDEGIDMKIRTLMEMYRKAAWDDEW